MKTRLLFSRLALILLTLGLALAGPLPLHSAAAEAPRAAPLIGDLDGFGLVSAEAGWLRVGQRLYWTDDDAQTWRDITPAAAAGAIQAVHFADANSGWAVLARGGAEDAPAFTLARTGDGGRSWAMSPLDLFAPDDPDAFARDVYPHFIDSQTGWLVFKRATSRAFNLGALFRTRDGGDTWTRLSIPIGEPVHFSDLNHGWTASEGERFITHDGGATWEAALIAPSDAPAAPGLSGVTMASAQAGWAVRRSGGCQADLSGQRVCTQTAELVRTRDGGATWEALTLPDGGARLTTRQTVVSEPPLASTQSAVINTVTRTQTYFGQGFDSCTKPTLQEMQDWYTNSPYGVWNLYLGGANIYAPCNTLTADYIAALAVQGWRFIPTWVGPQPACTTYSSRISYDLTAAYNQGVAEADSAINRANDLRLTYADGSGTIIYYDLEGYSGASAACRDSTKAFINGWTARLRARGNLAGVYGSPCSSYLSDFVGVANVPDAIWLAAWYLDSYDANATVWLGSSAVCLSNSLWVNHQRLRQYTGGHAEMWGSTSINIDSDVLDGPVADIAANPELPNNALELFRGITYRDPQPCLWEGFVEGEFDVAECSAEWEEEVSSLKLTAGWSARVFRDAGLTGPSVCYPLSDPDLSNETFAGGAPVDNNISSIRVYANPGCYDIRTYLPLIFR